MSYEVAVVGDQDTATGFALAGVTHVHIHVSKDETLAKLREFLTSGKIGLVLITHPIAEELGLEFSQMTKVKGLLPLVLRIPDKTGYVPKIDELTEIIRRTVGAEIVLRKGGG